MRRNPLQLQRGQTTRRTVTDREAAAMIKPIAAGAAAGAACGVVLLVGALVAAAVVLTERARLGPLMLP
jgi:hypothetical protein